MDVCQTVPQAPTDLADLLAGIASDFPAILATNLVGIYVWGSLTYDAFDARCSDADLVVVTRRDIDDAEFAALQRWFEKSAQSNPWTARLDMRFVIDGEFLDKSSRCCGFYGTELERHGSDGNPIIWFNVGACGITLWGEHAGRIAPPISAEVLERALLLELEYLEQGLAKNAGDRSDRAFRYNAYAVLTACRILYTARHGTIVSKDRACEWALATLPERWRPVIATAWTSRLADHCATTRGLETDGCDFVRFAKEQAGCVTQATVAQDADVRAGSAAG